jgi:AraC-like DNA-binding protein
VDTKGTFFTVKPKDELVGKHISYYYFHASAEPAFSRKFSFYPNYKHAITIYHKSDVRLAPHGSVVYPSEEEKSRIFYSRNIDSEIKVALNGPFNKTGIVFNPLGLNHFVDEPVSSIIPQTLSPFDYFGNAFETVADLVYANDDADAKAALLDVFFRERYCGFDEPVVKKAVQELLNSNGAVKVEELSEKLQVHRKTLLRLFKRHLCCSVEEYKKLVMFRNALNYSQQQQGSLSLTDVALYSLYYDQAHFIRHFKSVTKKSPKALLSKITKLGNQEVYWNFED